MRNCLALASLLATAACVTTPAVAAPSYFRISDATADEGAGQIQFAIRRTGISGTAKVRVSTRPGTALPGSDYTAIDQVLTFAPGEASKVVTVALINDTLREKTENFTLRVLPYSNALLYDDGSGTGIITDVSDTASAPPPVTPVSPPALSIDDVTIAEGAPFAPVTIRKHGVLNSLPSTFTLYTINGTAIAPGDYAQQQITITLAAGENSRTVNIPIADDNTPESTEFFSVQLVPGANSKLYDGTAVVTITDADVAPPPAPTVTDNKLDSEGDSISVTWSGNYTGIYAASRPAITHVGRAVGGSTIATMDARVANVLADNPEAVTVLIGANDLGNTTAYPSQPQFHAALMTYIGKVRAGGRKVGVATILPQCTTNSAFNSLFESRRQAENTAIRAEVGTRIDAVIDFAADTKFDAQSDACNTTYFQADGVHPTDAGQAAMAPIYSPVADQLLGLAVTPPPSGSVDIPTFDLAGAQVRQASHDVATDLQPSWGNGAIPGTAGPDVLGAFRAICGHGKFRRMDPILYPGQQYAGHPHLFTGDLGVEYNSTESTLLNSAESTCNRTGTGQSAQNSVYWISALEDGAGNFLNLDFNSIYYKRRPSSDPLCGDPSVGNKIGICIPFPAGLKMIAGSLLQAGKYGPANIRGQVYWNCYGTGAVPGPYANLAAAYAASPICPNLQAVIEFPDCWDGQYLWKVDRSHIVYAKFDDNGNFKCPVTNKYKIPTVTIHYEYRTDANWYRYKLSSDMMDPTQPRGWSLHADAWLLWDKRASDEMHANCIDKLLSASGGDLCSGRQFKGAQQPPYGFTNPNRLTPISSLPAGDQGM